MAECFVCDAAMERAERLILGRLGWRVRSGLGIPEVQ